MIEIKVDKDGASCEAKGTGIEILTESTIGVFKMCKMMKQMGGDELVDVFTKSLNNSFKMGLHHLYTAISEGDTTCVQINPADLLRQLQEEGDNDAE